MTTNDTSTDDARSQTPITIITNAARFAPGQIVATRGALVLELQALGFEVLPSGANFVFAKHACKSGADLSAKLREKSVVVRHFKQPLPIANYLRITIGTDAQSKQLISALTEILK